VTAAMVVPLAAMVVPPAQSVCVLDRLEDTAAWASDLQRRGAFRSIVQETADQRVRPSCRTLFAESPALCSTSTLA